VHYLNEFIMRNIEQSILNNSARQCIKLDDTTKANIPMVGTGE